MSEISTLKGLPKVPACDEFGNPADVALIQDAEFAELVTDDRLDRTVIPYQPAASATTEVAVAIETGRKSTKAMSDLGCTACAFSGECKVVEILTSNIETAKYVQELHSTVATLVKAPTWLQKARSAETGIDTTTPAGEQHIREILERAEDPSSGSLEDLKSLTNGFSSKPLESLPKSNFPELEKVSHLDMTPIPGHRIITPKKKEFDIFDASSIIGFDESRPTEEEMKTLFKKLLDRLEEIDSQGVSHIFTPDGKQQLSVTGWRKRGAEGSLAEIRIGGKARLYVTVPTEQKEGKVPRLVILGMHGDNAQMQDKFFNHINI